VLHTGARPAFAGFRARRALASEAVDRNGRKVLLASLAGEPVMAVAAIAKPQGFFDMLQSAGISIRTGLALPDHHDFGDWAQPPAGTTVLCTEKDAAKLWQVQPDALAVPLIFEPEPGFFQALDAKLSSLDG